jgi:hypothetical protein
MNVAQFRLPLAWPEFVVAWPGFGLGWPGTVVVQEETSLRNTGSLWAHEMTSGWKEHKGGLEGAGAC